MRILPVLLGHTPGYALSHGAAATPCGKLRRRRPAAAGSGADAAARGFACLGISVFFVHVATLGSCVLRLIFYVLRQYRSWGANNAQYRLCVKFALYETPYVNIDVFV